MPHNLFYLPLELLADILQLAIGVDLNTSAQRLQETQSNRELTIRFQAPKAVFVPGMRLQNGIYSTRTQLIRQLQELGITGTESRIM